MKKNFYNLPSSLPDLSGFTLIELLIVIVIIAALAVVVFVSLNPVKRLIDARDARRSTDVDTISKAIQTYLTDNASLPPSVIGLTVNTDYQIGNAPTGSCTQIHTGGCNIQGSNCVNLGSDLGQYLKSMPVDPLGAPNNTSATTGYVINLDANNTVTVKACRTGVGTSEGANDISAPPISWPNLVQNPSFESGTSPWTNIITAPAAATFALDNTTAADGVNSMQVNVTTIDANFWDIRLRSNAMGITNGQTYLLTFYAKRDSSPHTIQVYIQPTGSPNPVYFSQSYALTQSWTKYTATFTASATDAVYLQFDFGSNTGAVWIDNVSLQ